MTPDDLTPALVAAATKELTSALGRIKHCLGQLSDEQIWWRDHAAVNSIGNLLLHLCGNVRQWIIAGLGGAKDDRDRPAEFAERGPIPKDQLLRQLEAVVAEASAVLSRQTAAQLLRVRKIQTNDVNGLEAIFNSIPHFRGHTQEIIHMTRIQLGDAYQFAWKPKA